MSSFPPCKSVAAMSDAAAISISYELLTLANIILMKCILPVPPGAFKYIHFPKFNLILFNVRL
jgi:hypothetical protein